MARAHVSAICEIAGAKMTIGISSGVGRMIA